MANEDPDDRDEAGQADDLYYDVLERGGGEAGGVLLPHDTPAPQVVAARPAPRENPPFAGGRGDDDDEGEGDEQTKPGAAQSTTTPEPDNDSKGASSSSQQEPANGSLAKKERAQAVVVCDRDEEASSKRGSARAMMLPRDGGPQYKHQVQSVARPTRGGPDYKDQVRSHPSRDGATMNTSPTSYYGWSEEREPAQVGPDYKDQVHEVTPPPSPPVARRPAPAQVPGAQRQVGSVAAEVVQDQDTAPLSSESVSHQKDRAPTGTHFIPSANLVRDSSVYEAHPMNRHRRMLVWAVVVLAALAVGVTAGVVGARSASSSSSSSPDYEYRRPDNDEGKDHSTQRGPCPGLNTLANHGYINRDGQNINIWDMAGAIELVFGADAGDMLDIIFNSMYSGLRTVGVAEDGETPLIDLFDLHALDHDASLVREDRFYRPYPGFNESLFERLTASAVDGVLIGEQGEAHQRQRIIESRRDNPEVFLNETIGRVMALQGCLLQFFGDGPVKETVRVDELESFLKEEKIPESFALRGEIGLPPILRNDYAGQESRWRESVMEALTAPIQ